MKEQLKKDFDSSIKNLSLSQKDIEIKKFCLENFMDKGFPVSYTHLRAHET